MIKCLEYKNGVYKLSCSYDDSIIYTKIFKGNDHSIYHRVDGPAIDVPGKCLMWLINNKRHREDGPAIVWEPNGKLDLYEWYLNGVPYNFNKWLELTPISDEEKLMIKLKYA